MEQRPVLSLKTEIRQEQRLEMRMELQQIMALQYKILRMNEEELVDFASQDTSEKGQKKMMNIMRFVVAGRVKKAKPDLSWRDARKLAYKLIMQGVNQ